jgi:hypothetical protein
MGLTRNDVFPSRFIKHDDLDGKPATYTVHRITVEELGAERERKPVMYFEEISQGLGLNRTNWDTIEDLFGPDTDQWVGKRLQLYPAKTSFGGRRVDCIRVRAGSLADELNDELPGFAA